MNPRQGITKNVTLRRIIRMGWLAAIALTGLACAAAVRAQQNVYTTEERIDLSNRVVMAKCTAVEARKLEGGNIFTFSTFDTLALIKGSELKKVSLRVIGGEVGDVAMESPLEVNFTVGKKYVLFLGTENQDHYQTIAPPIFEASAGATGDEIVSRVPRDLALYYAKDGKPYQERPRELPLADFVFSLSKLAKTHR